MAWCTSDKTVMILRGSGDTHMRHSRVESSLFCQICTTPTQNACSWRLVARARVGEPPRSRPGASTWEHLQLRPGTPSAPPGNTFRSPQKLKSVQLSTILALGGSNLRNCRQFQPLEAQKSATVVNYSSRVLKCAQLSSILLLGLKPRSQDPGVGGSGGSL